MGRELNAAQADLDHVPEGTRVFRRRHSMTKEDEIDARWQREEHEGERHEHQHERELPMARTARARSFDRRLRRANASGTNGDVDDVRIAE